MRKAPAVVDTDVASAVFREHYLGYQLPGGLAATLDNRRLAISLITFGEAYFGARKAKWGPKRVVRMVRFYRESFFVVDVAGEDIAATYGHLRASTEAVGQPLAPNDLWIAACASVNGLPVITLNQRHFEPLRIFGVTLL